MTTISRVKNEFQWDGNGTELLVGTLKNECHDIFEDILKNLYPDKDKVTKADIPENKMKRETLF
jgi:hypothetical protein